MKDEKMLPLGEPTLHFPPPETQAPVNLLPKVVAPTTPSAISGMPTPSQQQWGVVISIVIIVLMIIIGAFYAWGERIAENRGFPETSITQ